MEEVILIKKLLLIYFIFIWASISFGATEVVVPKGTILTKVVFAEEEMRKRFGSYFKDIVKRPYDNLTMKIQVDQIYKELFSAGYFHASIKPELQVSTEGVTARIVVQVNERINFMFQGNKILTHQELRNKLLEKIKNEFGKADIKNLASFIAEEYEGVGFYQTEVKFYQDEGLDLDKKKVVNYYFVIAEGVKINVKEIIYRGNSYLKEKNIKDIFNTHASSLAKGMYYDKKFFDEFSDILKKEYLSRGFVFVEISKPRVVTNEEDKSVTVEYGISEKQQVTLRNINFQKVPSELIDGAKNALINKEGAPVNIVELESDLRKMIVYFQSNGYYFATIANLNANNLLVYDKSYGFVDLNPEIALDRQICFNEAIINGNVETDTRVINREIELEQGELITPAKLEVLRQKLSGLNLFSSLRITPYMMYEEEVTGCPKTNLVIQVKEKDFGLLEVAPGFRTDLGAKLSTGVVYNNLNGMNRSISLRLQGNRRFNLDGFDEPRRLEKKDLLEYSIKTSFVEPYLFHNVIKTQLEFETSASYQRIRFAGFDADILRISPQFSKTFTKWFSSSVRYQYEKIVQFGATETKDNDNFEIGGITPSVTFDFRDDVINPRKGAFFTLSSEWANSNFGSMKQSDLEVNFIKVINRNRFYYPLGDFTLALSIAMGYQKNFAEDILRDGSGNVVLNDNGKPKTRGYIPSIKVFRLDGYDEIRGYDEGEINRLIDGTPLGKVIVQREAYFTALKFEPRYDITDNVRVGVFFDAGRVYVDDFRPTKLRTSVGAGFKYLTPVGSLDFDYGFKLQRKNNPDQKRDSVGRFHLSIGFF